MNHPYRETLLAPSPTAPSKPLRCYVGLHRLNHFTVTASKKYICVGVRVDFFCVCGKHLGTRQKPTNRPVVIRVGAGWDGMGGA